MFTCNACFRRAINIFFYDASPDAILSRAHVARTRRPPVAHHSTVQSIRKGHHLKTMREVLNKSNGSSLRSKKSLLRGKPSRTERRDLIARERNRHHLDVQPAVAPGVDAVDGANPAVQPPGPLSTHDPEKYQMQFLKDPLALAKAVLARLKIGNSEGALKLVRLSDKDKVQNIVSWNHLMDYQMSLSKPREALKIYNDMKKRGHRPDAHTYTIMLRGFTENIHQPQAVQNALHIYNSMFAPNSSVTPNVIHTNAVINACARGQDMDALWSVAGRLPEKGAGAPDKWTFTTILNAITANVKENASTIAQEDGSIEAATQAFDKAVGEGRKLWEDIVARWRSGDLLIDQPLVCAMGRLLLLGSKRQDWSDVFSLVEQTMNISSSSPPQQPSSQNDDTLEESDFPPAEQDLTDLQIPARNEFRSFGGSHDAGNGLNTLAFAVPGNNALSMLLEAAIALKALPMGKMCWDILTNKEGPYKISPDSENFHSYLRLLRISRSSKVVCEMLREYCLTSSNKDFSRRGIFVLAMSTCVRDKNNPNVFDHASTVLDIMQDKLEQPDPKIMEMYLSLAIVTTPGISHLMPDSRLDPDPRKNNVMRALARLGPHALNVKELIKQKILEEEMGPPPDFYRHGKKDKLRKWERKRLEKMERQRPKNDDSIPDLSGFLQALVSAYDRLLTKSTKLPGPYVQDYQFQKRKLSAFVTKLVGAPKPSLVKKPAAEATNSEDEYEESFEEDVKVFDRSRRPSGRPREANTRRGGNRLPRREIEAERIRAQFPPQQLKPEHRTGGDGGPFTSIKRLSENEGVEKSSSYTRGTGRTGAKSGGWVQKGWGSGWDELVKQQASELRR